MSKEQGKPPKKWYKNWKIIVLLLVVLCVIAFIIFLSVTPKYGTSSPVKAYITDKYSVQNAVSHYASIHNGSFPILNGTYTNAECSNCSVIKISALLVENGGLFHEAPDGLYLSPSGNDNCGGNVDLGCSKEGSYIWLTDTWGNIFSYCAGVECTTNDSGYQDVWP